MTDTIHVDIVSAEHEVFSGNAEMVFAPAEMGEVGIAPGHAPFVTKLGPGEVRVKDTEGNESAFYVSGGMLEVQPKVITVLSDTAQRAEDLDEAAIMKAKEEAEHAFHEKTDAIDYAKARSALAETAAQLQTLQRLRKRGGR
ncbi:MAG: F0F1 ATP synthase subunit epsilon [Proteobacteria bacterium]|nr:F0F1 ATP synthase subunit epsilon [Pseudomonadota bacterium]NOG60949.1 F0F1 ATP synthase subunit epsilon [Pseudomonadota bacterium]